MNDFKYGIVPHVGVGQGGANSLDSNGLPVVASAFRTLACELMNDKSEMIFDELISILDGTHKLAGAYKAICKLIPGKEDIVIDTLSPSLLPLVRLVGDSGYVYRDYNLFDMIKYKYGEYLHESYIINYEPKEGSMLPGFHLTYRTDSPMAYINTGSNGMVVEYDLSKGGLAVYPIWTTDRVRVGFTSDLTEVVDGMIYNHLMKHILVGSDGFDSSSIARKLNFVLEKIASSIVDLSNIETHCSILFNLVFTLPDDYVLVIDFKMNSYGTCTINLPSNVTRNHLLLSDLHNYVSADDFDINEVELREV